MITLLGPILAAALLAQIQGGTLEGKFVDDDDERRARQVWRGTWMGDLIDRDD